MIESIQRVIDRCSHVERVLKQLYRRTKRENKGGGDKSMSEWKKCKKKPIEVEFREVQPNEAGVETLEGFKPCDPATHYIMRGVRDEIYPIDKAIFDETYEIVP